MLNNLISTDDFLLILEKIRQGQGDRLAHNFDPSDTEAAEILAGLFDAEDEVLRNGDLTSDFVFGVYKLRA